MAKITWEVIHPQLGFLGTLIARTRTDAIAQAKAEFFNIHAVGRDYGLPSDPIESAPTAPDYKVRKRESRGQ